MTSRRPLRIAIYARYSSDIQNPSSVDDQVALCRQLIGDQFQGRADARAALVFSDAAITGSIMRRPGVARLLDAAKQGRIDMVVAEGLDRLSRSLKDIAGIYETLDYHGVNIWTAHEGQITALHVGLKGTMNALQLRDMKARVKRGHRARIAAGYAASSCAYGYRTVRGVVDAKGRNVNGVREIDPAEAAVVRRAYEDFVAGKSVPEIVEGLNRDGIPAPHGGVWKRNAIMGGVKKQEGILRNEIYTGKLIFNRSATLRDPVTYRKRQIPRPESDWMKVEVPHLRIISDDLWNQVRRLDVQRKPKPAKPPPVLSSHNQHALTGFVKCGWCGGPKSLANKTRYLCSTHRYAKACRNSRGTREPVIEAAVFQALYERLKDGPDIRPLLAKAFAKEIRAKEQLAKQEQDLLGRIERLLRAVERGVNAESATQRILDLQDELTGLRATMAAELPSDFPDEGTIRRQLVEALRFIEMTRDVIATHLMYQSLLKAVVLTPIPDQRAGETMSITLRERGWPEFWRSIFGN